MCRPDQRRKGSESPSERTGSDAYQYRITTRKTPCGEGSDLGLIPGEDPQRLMDLHGPSEIVKQITSISTEPGGGGSHHCRCLNQPF